MLSVEDNELMCRVGPGTVMGNYMRQHWIPCMLSSEVLADDEPVRVLLLGEKLIAFRDSTGRVGLLQNHCPHRGASLFFGRNEEAGLRCVYHGWKFDVTGQCIDMPTEAIGNRQQATGDDAVSVLSTQDRALVRATAYPCIERGGVVWTYMGPCHPAPPLPEFESNMVAEGQGFAAQMECNYFQVLEGTIDTVHAGFLHRGAMSAADQPQGTFAEYMLRHRTPSYAVIDTDAGTCYGAYRDGPPGQNYWRIAQFLLPFYAMAPGGLLGGGPSGVACYVPMDDYSTLTIGLRAGRGRQEELARRAQDANSSEAYRAFLARRAAQQQAGRGTLPNSTDWHGRFRTLANAANDYLIDRELQRLKEGPDGYTGIQGVGTQDQAMTNSEGPIYDRTTERLGTSDAMIIQSRRRLITAAKTFAETGVTPPTVEHPEYYRLRSGSTLLPKDADWVEATAELRLAFREHPQLDWSITGGA